MMMMTTTMVMMTMIMMMRSLDGRVGGNSALKLTTPRLCLKWSQCTVTHNTIHFIHICTIPEKMKLELSEFLALELMQCSLKEEFCRFGAVPFVIYVLHCVLCNTLETVFTAQ